jgi:putative transposase
MIDQLRSQYPVRTLCRVLEVHPSGYYQRRRRVPGPRARANQILLQQVRRVFAQSRQTYGSPRVARQIWKQGLEGSENRVARLMRLHHLRAKAKSPFRPRTTDSRHHQAVAPNRLAQAPPPRHLNEIWVADITYIRTRQGWAYLAAVMDLCSRKIVGWSLSDSLATPLVREALQQARLFRDPAAGLLHHSDRGSQYASSAFRALLHYYQITPSMSATGHCYDNAAMESLWSTLKCELVHRADFADLEHARRQIGDYIETFYNRHRLHSALNYQSPEEFEQTLTQHDQ